MPRPTDLDPAFVEGCLAEFDRSPMVPMWIRNSSEADRHREVWLAMTWYRREAAKLGVLEDPPDNLAFLLAHGDDPWHIVQEALEELR